MITKQTRNIHKKTNRIANILIRGESFVNSTLSAGFGVSVINTVFGVIVAVDVLVDAGNINVIAGRGRRVVVEVSEGDGDGVKVSEGVPGVLDWFWVVVPVRAVTVSVAAWMGCAITIYIYINRIHINPVIIFIKGYIFLLDDIFSTSPILPKY